MHHHTLPSRVRLLVAALSLCALFLANSGAALAHPAPSVIHDYIVSLSPTVLSVESYLRVSPELVPQVYRSIDTNGDGQTSQDEADAWFKAHPSKLGLALDGKAVQPSISQTPSISQADLLQSIDHPIKMTYTATLAEPVSGKHRIQITYGDNYLDYDEYYISVANDTANDSHPQGVARNKYPATFQIVYHIPAPNETNVPKGEIAPPPYYQTVATPEPATPTAMATPVELAPVSGQTTSGGSAVSGILDSLRNWHGELWAGLGLALLALLIGALHALTPGHGKTMVAAYLIGSKGRVRDAVLLGGVVTFTHTVGVVILGLILLFVSTFTVPRNLQPILELISGSLIILLGGYLLLTRWRDARTTQPTPVRTTGSRKPTVQAALPEQRKVLAASGAGATTAQAIPTRPVALATATALPVEHSHDHDHSDGSHTHTHDGHTHTHSHPLPSDGMSLGSLVGLGVSGGLVPCPDALAILLLATGVGQFALGLGLVISFSIGLAAVLIAIGITLVSVKGALEKSRAAAFTKSDLWTRWVPLASAAIVVAVGLIMALSALGNFR